MKVALPGFVWVEVEAAAVEAMTALKCSALRKPRAVFLTPWMMALSPSRPAGYGSRQYQRLKKVLAAPGYGYSQKVRKRSLSAQARPTLKSSRCKARSTSRDSGGRRSQTRKEPLFWIGV